MSVLSTGPSPQIVNALCRTDFPTAAIATPDAPRAGSAAGTYELLLYRERCEGPEGATTVAVGRLALFDSDVDRAILSPLADSLRRALHWTYTFANEPANGCAVWTRRNVWLPSMATIHAGLLTRWSRRGDSLAFVLYISPDAGHRVQAAINAAGFQGEGHSWAAWNPEAAGLQHPIDRIDARYVGPPDVTVCESAARAEAARHP